MWQPRDFSTRACCGAIVIAAEPVTIPLLRRLHAVDVPGGRSSHTVPTPRGGGAPIAVGLLAAVAITRAGPCCRSRSRSVSSACSASSTTCAACRLLSRLLLQAAAAAVVACGPRLVAVGCPRCRPSPAVAAAVVWLVGFVNAFNFMDGVNGISGAHALIGGVAYACFAAWRRTRFGWPLASRSPRAPVPSCHGTPSAPGSSSATWAATRSARRWRCSRSALVMLGVPADAVAGPVALYLADVAWTLQRRVRARRAVA